MNQINLMCDPTPPFVFRQGILSAPPPSTSSSSSSTMGKKRKEGGKSSGGVIFGGLAKSGGRGAGGGGRGGWGAGGRGAKRPKKDEEVDPLDPTGIPWTIFPLVRKLLLHFVCLNAATPTLLVSSFHFPMYIFSMQQLVHVISTPLYAPHPLL